MNKLLHLNQREDIAYQKILYKLLNLPSGFQFPASWLFDPEPTCPRICVRLWQDVQAGKIAELQALGNRSKDGYRVK